MKYFYFLVLLTACFTVSSDLQADGRISALLLDGQLDNHPWWRGMTPLIQGALDNTGRFRVEVLTLPTHDKIDADTPRPDFAAHDVVVFNYNAPEWPDDMKAALESYVRSGGGVVIIHSADNAFPKWPEYNRMIGLGGWGGRNEKDGPYIRWRNGKVVRDPKPGNGGHHGKRHEYLIDNRNPEHPIMQGLPAQWLHSRDELYEQLRGPAEEMTVLATAYADPATGGSGENEPVLWTIDYHKGRVFHTVLGDNVLPLFNVGFQSTLGRGAEWAATGVVTIPLPKQLPEQEHATTRHPQMEGETAAAGWQALFNGKDLTGWKQVNGTADYRVNREEASIVGTTSEGSPNSFLSTEKDYGDFELTFEIKLDHGELNSGVQIRSHQYAEDDSRRGNHSVGRVYGYQVEIEASRDEKFAAESYGDAGFIYDEARRGWLNHDRQQLPEARAAFKNGQWNHYRILAVGDHLQSWVNGVLCTDIHDSEDASGGIMLQVHSIGKGQGPYSVRWRNIFLKEISMD